MKFRYEPRLREKLPKPLEDYTTIDLLRMWCKDWFGPWIEIDVTEDLGWFEDMEIVFTVYGWEIFAFVALIGVTLFLCLV
jgi:hypothetical protein